MSPKIVNQQSSTYLKAALNTLELLIMLHESNTHKMLVQLHYDEHFKHLNHITFSLKTTIRTLSNYFTRKLIYLHELPFNVLINM